MRERLTGTRREIGISEGQRGILDLLSSLDFSDQVVEKLIAATSEGGFLVPPGFPLKARQIFSAAFEGVRKLSREQLSQGSIIDLMVQERGKCISISIRGGISQTGGNLTVLTGREGEVFDFGIRGGVFLDHLRGRVFFEREAPALPVSQGVARDDEQRRYGGLRRIDIGFDMPEEDVGGIKFVKFD